MDVYRTPDECFASIEDFPFEPNYVDTDGLRIAYVDEGNGPAVVLMHGEPSWSYLYRKMMPPLLEAGYRVIAPDLVGFGRSDKPTAPSDYSYQRHVDWMSGWFASLDISDVTLFCQDWGGLIGLRLVANDPDRFSRVAVANTGLPTGEHPLGAAFEAWQTFAATSSAFDVGRVIQGATVNELPAEVVAAYDAPFPVEEAKAGARVFPALVPSRPDDPAAGANRQAWEVLKSWEKPFLCLFSDSDPVTAGWERPFLKLVPGTAGQPHRPIVGAGHFLQEDAGELLGEILVAWSDVS